MAASVCGSMPPCWASIVPALRSASKFLLPGPKNLLFPVLGSMVPLVPTSSLSAAPCCCASGGVSDEPGNTEDFVVGSEICGSRKGGMLWWLLSHRRR